MEQFGVGEEQRRIPAKQDQAGDQAGIGITLDVVIALQALGATQDRGVRPPAVPQELDHGNHDRQPDAGNRAQHRDADRTDDRQPELPALDAKDSREVGDLDEANGRGDHDCSQCTGGQMSQEVRRHQQQQGHAERADDAGQLGSGTCGFSHGRA